MELKFINSLILDLDMSNGKTVANKIFIWVLYKAYYKIYTNECFSLLENIIQETKQKCLKTDIDRNEEHKGKGITK